jgi:hypothetical protein
MSTCTDWFKGKITETKTWEQDGGWPDTSQPPDSQTSTPLEYIDFVVECDAVGMPGGICGEEAKQVVLELVPFEYASSFTTSKKWTTIEPEIPHLKTYYIEQTKTTISVTGWTQTYTCIPLSALKEFEAALKDYFPTPAPPPLPPTTAPRPRGK